MVMWNIVVTNKPVDYHYEIEWDEKANLTFDVNGAAFSMDTNFVVTKEPVTFVDLRIENQTIYFTNTPNIVRKTLVRSRSKWIQPVV